MASRPKLLALAFCAACVLVFAAGAAGAQAATYNVTKTADTADGTCSVDCSLREAVIAANASPGPDTIAVPNGTYTLSIPSTQYGETGDITTGAEGRAEVADLDLSESVTINGASEAGTIIEGGTTRNGAVDRIFDVRNGQTAATLTHMTLRNGFSFGSAGISFGGAIRNLGNLTLQHVTESNSFACRGAGIYSPAGSGLTVEDSTISGNAADSCSGAGVGGAIYTQAIDAVVRRSTITSNVASFGAGIDNDNGARAYPSDTVHGTITVEDSTISNNTGATLGGGLLNDGQATVTGSTFSGNGAHNGGGLVNDTSSTLAVSRSTVSGNTSADSGGGITQGDGASTFTVDESTISGNHGGTEGGGVMVLNSSATISNSTLSGNDAGYGAGIALGSGGSANGTATLVNDTFSGNTATQLGGAIRFVRGSLTMRNLTIDGNSASSGGGGGLSHLSDTATVVNTIFGDNTGGNCAGGVTSQGHNIDAGTTCGFGAPGDLGYQAGDQSSTAPALGSLQDNGGPTHTKAPASNSPAVDAGDNAACSANLGTNRDQRGVTRPLDGNADNSAVCDIGAVEIGPASASVTPSSWDFGDVKVGSTGTKTFTVKNTGGSNLDVNGFNFTGGTGNFHVGSTNTCFAGVVQPGEECTVQIAFSPQSTGAKSSTMTLDDDAPNDPQVALQGNGLPGPAPAASVTPSSWDFGDVKVGSTGTKSFTVKNTGDAPLTINGFNFSGGTGNFHIGSTNSCFSTSIQPDATCSVEIAFSPESTGAKGSTMTIDDNASNDPQVALTGNGTPGPTASFATDPANPDFGQVTADGSKKDLEIKVKNTGQATMHIGSVEISPVTGDAFSIVGETCSQSNVPAAGFCVVKVRFQPDAEGQYDSTLDVDDDAPGGPHSVALTGDGTNPPPPVDTTDPTIDVGSPHSGEQILSGASQVFLFGCFDGQGDVHSGIASCVGRVDGHPVQPGDHINTGAVGHHVLTVDAKDKAGNSAHVSVPYDVVAPATAAQDIANDLPSSASGNQLAKGITVNVDAPQPETVIVQTIGATKGGEIVNLNGSSIVNLNGSSIAEHTGADIVNLNGSSIVNLNGSSIVNLNGSSIVNLNGSSIVNLNGSSKLVAASHKKKKPKAKGFLLGDGGHLFTAPGSAKIKVKAGKAGKKLLAKAHRKNRKKKGHKKAKPVKVAITTIVGNLNGVKGSPAAIVTRWIKVKP